MDYSKLKVTELKEELKKRGIPTTKLTRKQDIIDRLVEEDAKEPAEDASIETDQPVAVQDVVQPTVEAEAEALAAPEPELKDDEEPVPSNGVHAEELSHAQVVPEVPDAVTPAQVTAVETTAADQPSGDGKPPRTNDEPAPSTPIPLTTDGTSLDSRKRKRRSPTPSVSESSVKRKLAEAEDVVVHMDAEPDAAQTPTPVVAANIGEVKKQRIDGALGPDDVKMQDGAGAEVMPSTFSDDVPPVPDSPADGVPSDPMDGVEVTRMGRTPEPTTQGPDQQSPSPKAGRSPNERRFKDLVGPSATPDKAVDEVSLEEEVAVAPAKHPATAALYIRELVRPIRTPALKEHLAQLATPPGAAASDPDTIVETLHVDALATHAFALFNSISAASRARASLHSRVWPPDPTRRPLWVDFVPEERIAEWTRRELSNGGSRPSQAKRWEVNYDATDADGSVDARLVEAPTSAAGTSQQRQALQTSGAPPSGPRQDTTTRREPAFSTDDVRAPSQPLVSEDASFLELDKLFRCTAAKPKLYWLPVAPDLAESRRDELQRLTSRDWDAKADAARNRGDVVGRGLDQLRRFTFEDRDLLVDGGPEYGGGRAFARGEGSSYRGGGGGRGFARGRGGGGGDRWR